MTFSSQTLSLFCLVFVLVQIDITSAKTFTLPGDPLWPTQREIKRLSGCLKGTLVTINDTNYQIPHTYNLRTGPPKPAIIVTPATTRDITKALHFCKRHVLRIAVVSTGHHQDVRNSVDNALLLNMSNFNQKEVNIARKTLTVGPGQTFADIHTFVNNKTNGTLVALSAAHPSVGPAGWVLGGGHGRITRLYGLGVDALISVKLVLANGKLTTASATHNQDLFRSLRGGAGSAFGVIYSITFQLYKDPGPMSFFYGIYEPSDNVGNLFQEFMLNAPNYIGAYYLPQIDASANYIPIIEIDVHCFNSNTKCDTALSSLYNIPGCYAAKPFFCQVTPQYTSYSAYLIENLIGDVGGLYSESFGSTALNFKTPGQLAVVNQWLRSYNTTYWPYASIGCSGNAILGGVSTYLDPFGINTAVAPAMRNAIMAITCYVGYGPGISRPDLVAKMDSWADNTLKPLGVDGWVYWNEPQHNFVDNDWQTRYWGSKINYALLRAVKRKYDPTNVLTCYQCVGWEDIQNVDPAVCPNDCSCSNALEPNTCVNVVIPP